MNGETIPSITLSKAKATNWIITLNNPTREEVDRWTMIKQNHWVKDANGQLEMGEEGTPHIQGHIKTESVRFAQLKKLFPRAHIEIAKNSLAVKNYCVKPETRLESLPIANCDNSIHTAVYKVCIDWFRMNYYDENYQRCIQSEQSIEQGIKYALEQSVWLEDSTREWMFDKAVSTLIRSGVKNIEFIAASQVTRSAFIKYFPAIIHRENAKISKSPSFTQESPSQTQNAPNDSPHEPNPNS